MPVSEAVTAVCSPSIIRPAVSPTLTCACGGRPGRQADSSSSAGAAAPANSGRPVTSAIPRPATARVSRRRACRDRSHRSGTVTMGPASGPGRPARAGCPARAGGQARAGQARAAGQACAADGSVRGVGTLASSPATTSSGLTWRTHSSGRSVMRWASAGTATLLMSSGIT